MRNPRALLFCISLLCLSLIPSECFAGKNLVVGVSLGYPPYYYENEGTLDGICIEIIESISSSLGITVVFRSFPWKRLLLSAEKGEVDAIMPLFRTKEREQYLDFHDLILAYEEVGLFVARESSLTFQGDFDRIAAQSIGVVDGYSYGEEFDKKKGLEKLPTQSDFHLLQMFSHKRFPIGVGNRHVISYNAEKLGIAGQIKFLTPPLSREPLYLGFSKLGQNRHLAMVFVTKLQEMKKNGKYDLILEKYDL